MIGELLLDVMEKLLKKCRIRNQLVRECLAECLGVLILILLGCGSVAQSTTSRGANGQFFSINVGFALGVTFGVFICRGVSGGHLNPAVSLTLCVLGRFNWNKLPFYAFCQTLGGFLGAAIVGLQYYDAIRSVSGGPLLVTGVNGTAGIFATYPAEYLSLWGGFVDQVVGTAVLMLCVMALTDQRNTVVPDALVPPLVGGVILVLGTSMGSNCGYALNPARDLGPRLFTFVAGWGSEVFTAGGNWWWVPIVAPCLGALLGGFIYELMIQVHHPPPPLEPKPSSSTRDVAKVKGMKTSQRRRTMTSVH